MNGSNDKTGGNGEKTPTPFQKFQALAKKVVGVPKSEVDKKIKERRAERKKT